MKVGREREKEGRKEREREIKERVWYSIRWEELGSA